MLVEYREYVHQKSLFKIAQHELPRDGDRVQLGGVEYRVHGGADWHIEPERVNVIVWLVEVR